MSIRNYLKRVPAVRRIHSYAYFLRFLRSRNDVTARFSQYGEELLIQNIVPKVRFFIDIGANDGISGSNTFYFALRGARGICFEPVSEPFRRLSSLYALRGDVVCRKLAISDQDGETEIVAADYYSFIPETEDKSHSDASRAWEHLNPKSEKIVLRTFASAISGCQVPSTVDLLSVDVEGHELKVLRSIPYDNYRFGAIVVETHIDAEGERIWQHRDLSDINLLLRSHGYLPVTSTAVNTIYAPAN